MTKEEDFVARAKAESELKTFFGLALMNPAFHWFFTEGLEAYLANMVLPSVSSLLNGIEASLRVTVRQIAPDYNGKLELPPYETMSNWLLTTARDAGMPVHLLAFPSEADFTENLETKTNVRIVQLRHDVCHGNILPFIEYFEAGPDHTIEILTPDCLGEILIELLQISFNWAKGLAEFREQIGRRPEGNPIPEIPPFPRPQIIVMDGQAYRGSVPPL